MKRLVKNIIYSLRKFLFWNSKNQDIVFVLNNDSIDINEIEKRIHFFDEKIRIKLIDRFSFRHYFDFSILSVAKNATKYQKRLLLKKDLVFDFDPESNYLDGWDFHRMLTVRNHKNNKDVIKKSYDRFKNIADSLKLKYDKTYIFGTGPSLEKADTVDWSDGIRIVSNTIVKDKEMWKCIDPHFIVAGDAIYHFGFGNFAKAFRSDLKECLKYTSTYLVFPAIFYAFCLKEFGEENEHRLIPIPIGNLTSFDHDLIEEFSLPALGNVLPLLLLPLACTLSKNVFLWGFDGRAPDAKLFWKNSSRHFYDEHVEELKKLHPEFFRSLVPKGNESAYVNKVHGDALDDSMTAAERKGFKFIMMHFTYTNTLFKRYEAE